MKKMIALALMLAVTRTLALTVILPETPSVNEQKAAEELATHLTRYYGKTVSVQTENGNRTPPCIYVGKTLFAQKNNIDSSKLENEEWVIRAVDASALILAGGTRGIIYSALELLERVYGVSWLDEEFTYVPKTALRSWPLPLALQGKPAFAIRGIYAYFKGNDSARYLFQARNRQNLFHDEPNIPLLKSWNISRIYGSPRPCHTYYDYTRDWKVEHDDCFSMDASGKRIRSVNASGPGQICFTNPKTLELFAEKLKEFIRRDRASASAPPLIYDVSANDNETECQCPECQKRIRYYQSYGGLVLHFTNQLAEKIEREYPDIKIQMFAYMSAAKVPVSIKAHKNVIVRIAQLGSEWNNVGFRDTLRPLSHRNNQASRETIQEWSKISAVSIWDYWIIYGKNTALGICYDAIRDNLRFYKKNGIDSLFIEQEEPMQTTFYALRLWLGYRFMNNPERDLDAETMYFLRGYYGEKSAPAMKELLQEIIRRSNGVNDRINDVPLARRTDLDHDFFKTADTLIAKALAGVENEMQKKHILKERFVLDYANLRKHKLSAGKDIAALFARLQSDFQAVAPAYLSPKEQAKQMDHLNHFIKGISYKLPPLSGFEKMDVAFDLAWPTLNPHYKSKIVDMPDAVGGRAVQMKDGAKEKGMIQFGFYNAVTKSQEPTITIPPELIPQDEKFHFYRLGKVNIPSKGYVWAHPSWSIQRSTNEFYFPENKLLNDYIIYISIKAEGPLYVKGSQKVNSQSVDRIVFVRPPKDGRSFPATPLPEQYSNRKFWGELSGFEFKKARSLKMELVRDPDSKTGVAVKLGSHGGIKHGVFQIGFYDREKKQMTYSSIIPQGKIPQDEKYHLYSLGKLQISSNCYFFLTPSCELQCELGRFHHAGSDNRYQIVASVKAEGPAYVAGSKKENGIFLERIMLFQPEEQ